MYVGLDVGGTFLKGARIDGTGRVETRIHEPVARDSAEKLLEQMTKAVERLGGGGPLGAVGVALPGIVDHSTTRVRAGPNLPALSHLDGTPLADQLTNTT